MEQSLELRYKYVDGLVEGKPKTPAKGSEGAAGYDLFASTDAVVKARDKCLISTGIVLEIPRGTYGRVAPRSGLALKHFIDVGAGVIDSDYRGEIKVLLFNHGPNDFEVKTGDRIAQIIIERIAETKLVKIESLTTTNRGEGGFGSTGVSQN